MAYKEESVEENIAFYDEFFCDESDPGIPVEVQSGNKKAVIHMKRKLDIDTAQKVFNKAAKFKLNKSTGQKDLVDYDETEAVIQSIALSIASWSFQYRDNKPVPINDKTVRRLDATIIEQLKEVLNKQTEGRKETLDPFVNNSDTP